MNPFASDSAIAQHLATLEPIASGAYPGALVWQVDDVSDYAPFAALFSGGARKTLYFRFGEGSDPAGVDEIHSCAPQAGFEPFIDGILRVIQERGAQWVYLFDCISPLAADWFSDQMVGNFFVIVSQALRVLEGSACFSILRNLHSRYAMEPITDTASGLFDVCRHGDRLYVQPLKIAFAGLVARHRLHVWEAGRLEPVLDSHTAAAVLTGARHDNLGLARHHLGVWSRTFVEAEALLESMRAMGGHEDEAGAMSDKILRMAVSRDGRVLELVRRFFSLEDLVFLGTRMLGTGLIGGKAADMLLARAALARRHPEFGDLIEAHDSFFIPSDVFYTFLVQNDVWALRQRLLRALDRLDIAKEARRRIMNGVFPAHIVKRFEDMLDYYGETPLVVRSSSLLEDSFGNAFSGKYESVFCLNHGDRATRLEELINAIKTVYASAMNREALDYRAAHGLLERDEQMAVLVQRVSGAFHGAHYFPHLAGVAFSFNPYVWHEDIDSRAGVLRLVFGLGTRAVNRSDDDYTRLVALNVPMLRPDHHESDLPAPAQQWVDALDLERGGVVSTPFRELAPHLPAHVLDIVACEDTEMLRAARRHNLQRPFALRLSFDALMKRTPFIEQARAMLATLEEVYGTPVDVEFAVNFTDLGAYHLHLLQCRPMQVKGVDHAELPPLDISQDAVVVQAGRPVIGRSRFTPVDYLLYVSPAAYSALPEREQYAVARLIGELNRRISGQEARGNLMLIGPGRWGSTTPALGLPVSFSEISRAAVLCEVLAVRDDLVTEVSLGTHFFNDLVEMDMLYMALTPGTPRTLFDTRYLEDAPNHITDYVPEALRYENVLRLVAIPGDTEQKLFLRADTRMQQVCLYRGFGT